jgi:hypothetical protein
MNGVARTFVLAVVDVCVAGLVALVFWMNVGVAGGSDTNPPTCTTSTGRHVDCSLDGSLRFAQAAIFVAVLVTLVTWQVVRPRNRRRRETSASARSAETW